MRLAIYIAILLLSPLLAYAQNVPDDDVSKQPVPGTLTPAQQAEIDKALPPLNPPEIRPPAPPRIATKEKEKKPELKPLEWAKKMIADIEMVADNLYKEKKSYAGLNTEMLEKELESLEAPWGGEVRVIRAVAQEYTIRLPNVPPKICGEIFNEYNFKAGIRFINLCSSVKRTPLMYSYSSAFYKQEEDDDKYKKME